MQPGRILRGPIPVIFLLAAAMFGLLTAFSQASMAQQPGALYQSDKGVEVPPGVDVRTLQDQFEGKFSYDSDDKIILWKGTMSENERDQLVRAGNNDAAWSAAIRALFERAKASANLSGTEQNFGMTAQNMDLTELLHLMATRYSLNILVGKKIEGKVTMALDKVPLQTALDAILKSQGYTVQIIPNPSAGGKPVYIVVEPSAPAADLRSAIVPVPRSAQNQVDLEFTPLVEQVSKMLIADEGRIIANENARLIFIEDTPDGISRIKDFITQVRSNLPERTAEDLLRQQQGKQPASGPQVGPQGGPQAGPQGGGQEAPAEPVNLPMKKLYRITRDFESTMEDLLRLIGVKPTVVNYKDGIILINALEAEHELVKSYMDERAKINPPEDPLPERITTRVYTLKQKAEEVSAGLEPFLTPNKGRIVVNAQLNSLIITDLVLNFDIIERYIRELDAAPQQVLIESTIMEATLDDTTQFGLSSFFNRGAGSGTIGYQGKGFDPNAAPPSNTPPGISPFRSFNTGTYNLGFISGTEWEVALNALQTTIDTNILSRPKLVVANNRKGTITIGTEIPYIDVAGGSSGASQGVKFKPVNLTMDVTPYIEPGDRIRLELSIKVDANTGVASLGGIGQGTPIISNRSALTEVYINDGETLVIGGLYEERESDTVDKLPILGDLPVLGQLFRSTSLRKQKTDLLFIITPRIVRDRTEVKITRNGRELRVYQPIEPQVPDWYTDRNFTRLRGGQ